MKLPPFKLDRFFDGREHAPFSLGGSVCNERTVESILALELDALERLIHLPLAYQDYAGHPDLRAAIAALYRDPLQAANVVVTSGAQEGIFALFNILLEPGDRVIVQKPCYQLLSQLPETLGCEVVPWTMHEAHDWTPDIDGLGDLVNARTTLIVVNSPHNPTGFQFSQPAFEALVDLARSRGIYLLSDEVLRYTERDDRDRLPAAAEVYERAISVSDMSKAFGMPGARVGWLVSQDDGVLRRVLAFKDYLTITGNAVGHYLSTIALAHADALLMTNRTLLGEHRRRLQAFIHAHAPRVTWSPPRAGTTAFIRFGDATNTDDLADDALRRHGVLVTPGSTFDYGHHHLRIGYGSPRFPDAIHRFDAYLRGAYGATRP